MDGRVKVASSTRYKAALASPTDTVYSSTSSEGSGSFSWPANTGGSGSSGSSADVPSTGLPLNPIFKPTHNPHRYVAISAQYVLVSPQRTPGLARISIVDYRGNVLYEAFCRPLPGHQIEDYRSSTTGIKSGDLSTAPPLALVREQVTTIIRDKVIIGHSLWHHLSLVGLRHPAIDTRDVALYLPFQRAIRSTVSPLQNLVALLMRRKIGLDHEHPVEEARAALDLFRSYEDPWEDEIRAGSWPCALPPSEFRSYFN